MSALPLPMVWRHKGIKRSAKHSYYHTTTKDSVYYSICNYIAIESDATHYFQRPPCCSGSYGQLSMVWPARPSPDHAHSPPADSPELGAKVTRDTGERPQLSNLRIYSPVKRAKPFKSGVCHKGDVGRSVLEAFSRKRAKQGLLEIRPLLTLPYQVSVR